MHSVHEESDVAVRRRAKTKHGNHSSPRTTEKYRQLCKDLSDLKRAWSAHLIHLDKRHPLHHLNNKDESGPRGWQER